ncbi:MAG TPA: endopeptidase La [Erysipelotrichaceae bacterium]|nr:endopeptidase La [Erysipelotrichaceae bacterium]
MDENKTLVKITEEDLISVPTIATRGVILFPNQEVMIEVGRPKSLEAISATMDSEKKFVFIVTQKDVLNNDPTIAELYDVGTIAKVVKVSEEKDYSKLTLRGLVRAKITNFDDSKENLEADLELLKDYYTDESEADDLVMMIARNFDRFVSNFMKSHNLPEGTVQKMTESVDPAELSDYFAQILPMPFEKRQALLELNNVNERLFSILEDMSLESEKVSIDSDINKKVKERIDESQKEYYLREKMRAIKEELGDVSSSGDDIEDLKARIEDNPYPKEIKEKALNEIKRYEMVPPASGESGVIRNYLDWLLDVPWWQETTDNDDLNLVEERLNEDHYGLEKVKERILEYLAVKQVTDSLEAPILALVGPPGVGKTSLAKSVARALDREFVKISLGGVRDEAEIRGHRRTYLGALPGRFIQGMKKAGVINPVFLIDEIDKMGADYKGDPSSAMLEVLDPEQNAMFSDHYLEEAYDLSKVLFIATANYLGNIPEPLKDRLEIINLSSYTEEEKLNIAIDHLIAKNLIQNGLKSDQIDLSEEMIRHLIRHYTREAGVRQLDRVISSICRKSILAITKDKEEKVTITKELIEDWLGPEQFEYGVKEKKDQIGVVTGLAYTQYGGDILPIEVTTFEGKGKLIITGQLGDVMKESAEIAIGYVKTNAKKFEIDPKFFEKHDIHIHVPEGAVPKDGPSAGITLTTALVSVLTNKPVLSSVAMTGEVTLRGNVLPIGGLKEKTLAAYRSGITKILIPKKNEKDLHEIPDVVKEAIEIVSVETMEEVLEGALV